MLSDVKTYAQEYPMEMTEQGDDVSLPCSDYQRAVPQVGLIIFSN